MFIAINKGYGLFENSTKNRNNKKKNKGLIKPIYSINPINFVKIRIKCCNSSYPMLLHRDQYSAICKINAMVLNFHQLLRSWGFSIF